MMTPHDTVYQYYLNLLKTELKSCTGCTEPIAIALVSAKAKAVLSDMPDKVLCEVSRSVIKNAKSVVVPNTGGLKGIKAAIAAGVIAGNPEASLGVIQTIDPSKYPMIETYLKSTDIQVKTLETDYVLDIQITTYKGNHYAKVRLINHHDNIVLIEKNNDVLLIKDYIKETETTLKQSAQSTVKGIVEFADMCELSDVQDIIDLQIKNNQAIAQEGIDASYGANIGSVLLKAYGSDVINRAKAYAAAASDARMSGSTLPVTIVSGSGNQGITVSLPVIEYAKHLNSSKDRLTRALIISNLVTIHQKHHVGKLSAYCGAVFAGAGAGAGIAYLHGGDYEVIAHSIVNALAIISGMICDGAKPSCAAKIAAAVDAGILGYHMYLDGQQFYGGDGIVVKGIENTIINVARLATDGMKHTESEIVKMMTENQ